MRKTGTNIWQIEFIETLFEGTVPKNYPQLFGMGKLLLVKTKTNVTRAFLAQFLLLF